MDAGDAWAGFEGLLALRDRAHAWARSDPRVHAAVAFGSTERTDRPADAWSDLDLLIVVDDAEPWFADLAWVDGIGPSWVRLVTPAPIPGIDVVQVVFAGGYDADLIPVDHRGLASLADPDVAAEVFGHGARIVFDRTAVVPPLPATAGPSVTGPTSASFAQVVSTWSFQMVWATKRVRRGELWRAHDDIDDYMRDRLLTMLEWHALARGVPDVYPESRRIEHWLPADVVAELPGTFARYDAGSIAEALVRSHALFGRVAREVAGHHGFAYPEDADVAIGRWVADRRAEMEMPRTA
jgi:aminoglycoside 6-adenylyltransferase